MHDVETYFTCLKYSVTMLSCLKKPCNDADKRSSSLLKELVMRIKHISTRATYLTAVFDKECKGKKGKRPKSKHYFGVCLGVVASQSGFGNCSKYRKKPLFRFPAALHPIPKGSIWFNISGHKSSQQTIPVRGEARPLVPGTRAAVLLYLTLSALPRYTTGGSVVEPAPGSCGSKKPAPASRHRSWGVERTCSNRFNIRRQFAPLPRHASTRASLVGLAQKGARAHAHT